LGEVLTSPRRERPVYYEVLHTDIVVRRKFGPKREEVAADWRRLHNEELHNLYASPNIIRVIKSRRIR
jgi:hypothetical protein